MAGAGPGAGHYIPFKVFFRFKSFSYSNRPEVKKGIPGFRAFENSFSIQFFFLLSESAEVKKRKRIFPNALYSFEDPEKPVRRNPVKTW